MDTPQPQTPLFEPKQAHIPEVHDLSDVAANKDMAALSYVWVLSVIVYIAKRQSSFVRFHAKQGMVLFALSLLCWRIPVVGRLLELLILAFCVFGFIAAAQGQWKKLPLIYSISVGKWSELRSGWKDLVQSAVALWRNTPFAGKRRRKSAESAPTSTQPL
jgi:fumarate reductase subunit D